MKKQKYCVMNSIQSPEEFDKDLETYLKNTYGHCKVYDAKKKHSCNCIDPHPTKLPTTMNTCPNWISCNCKNYEELREYQLKIHKEMYK